VYFHQPQRRDLCIGVAAGAGIISVSGTSMASPPAFRINSHSARAWSRGRVTQTRQPASAAEFDSPMTNGAENFRRTLIQ
jgi:hypothetical protein